MDDEEMVRSYGSALLNYLGYSTETVSNGEQAISLFSAKKSSGQPFDVVILDINIPNGMGGDEAIKKLLHIDPDIKAVVSSGDVNSHLMTDFREYGFRAALPKPYSTSELHDVIASIMS